MADLRSYQGSPGVPSNKATPVGTAQVREAQTRLAALERHLRALRERYRRGDGDPAKLAAELAAAEKARGDMVGHIQRLRERSVARKKVDSGTKSAEGDFDREHPAMVLPPEALIELVRAPDPANSENSDLHSRREGGLPVFNPGNPPCPEQEADLPKAAPPDTIQTVYEGHVSEKREAFQVNVDFGPLLDDPVAPSDPMRAGPDSAPAAKQTPVRKPGSMPAPNRIPPEPSPLPRSDSPKKPPGGSHPQRTPTPTPAASSTPRARDRRAAPAEPISIAPPAKPIRSSRTSAGKARNTSPRQHRIRPRAPAYRGSSRKPPLGLILGGIFGIGASGLILWHLLSQPATEAPQLAAQATPSKAPESKVRKPAAPAVEFLAAAANREQALRDHARQRLESRRAAAARVEPTSLNPSTTDPMPAWQKEPQGTVMTSVDNHTPAALIEPARSLPELIGPPAPSPAEEPPQKHPSGTLLQTSEEPPIVTHPQEAMNHPTQVNTAAEELQTPTSSEAARPYRGTDEIEELTDGEEGDSPPEPPEVGLRGLLQDQGVMSEVSTSNPEEDSWESAEPLP